MTKWIFKKKNKTHYEKYSTKPTNMENLFQYFSLSKGKIYIYILIYIYYTHTHKGKQFGREYCSSECTQLVTFGRVLLQKSQRVTAITTKDYVLSKKRVGLITLQQTTSPRKSFKRSRQPLLKETHWVL